MVMWLGNGDFTTGIDDGKSIKQFESILCDNVLFDLDSTLAEC